MVKMKIKTIQNSAIKGIQNLAIKIIVLLLALILFMLFPVKVHAENNDNDNPRRYLILEEYEQYLLARIAMAEAEIEPVETKAYVIVTVLNRVESEDFPDQIGEVLYQDNQFSPMDDGRWEKCDDPTDECWDAVRMVQQGWGSSDDVLYFEDCEGGSPWLDSLDLQFQSGGMRFYSE